MQKDDVCVQVQEKIPQRSMTYFQVDMNVTPTPPTLTPNDPDAYSIAMHTIQSMCVQVDMNVVTPTPPHPNPTPNDPYVYSIAGFYMRAWF